MANAFVAQQRLSQDERGKTLTLVDFSNYNGIESQAGNLFVNPAGNDDDLNINQFISRKWILEDIHGNIEEVIFGYTLIQENKCTILIDVDKYLKITLIVSTAANSFHSTLETGLHRQAEHKLYILSHRKGCCTDSQNTSKTDAKDFIDSSRFKLSHYDKLGFQEDINAANKLLDSVI